jgi:hypothetical protein
MRNAQGSIATGLQHLSDLVKFQLLEGIPVQSFPLPSNIRAR